MTTVTEPCFLHLFWGPCTFVTQQSESGNLWVRDNYSHARLGLGEAQQFHTAPQAAGVGIKRRKTASYNLWTPHITGWHTKYCTGRTKQSWLLLLSCSLTQIRWPSPCKRWTLSLPTMSHSDAVSFKEHRQEKDVPLVEFMYLAFTRMPGESYCRWLRSSLLCLCDVFQALINSLACWPSRRRLTKNGGFGFENFVLYNHCEELELKQECIQHPRTVEAEGKHFVKDIIWCSKGKERVNQKLTTKTKQNIIVPETHCPTPSGPSSSSGCLSAWHTVPTLSAVSL